MSSTSSGEDERLMADCTDPSALLKACLVRLAEENAGDISKVKDNLSQGLFRQGLVAEFAFTVLEELQVCDQARFMAIDMFDRFMQKHIEKLHRKIYRKPVPDSFKHSDWRRALNDVKSNLELYIVSSCQVASKFISSEEVVRVADAQAALHRLGRNFTAPAIRASEILVLDALGYHLTSSTSYDFVETILETLGHNLRNHKQRLAEYKAVAVKLLTVLYVKCDEIYTGLLKAAGIYNPSSSDYRVTLKEVQADKVLAAVAVIAAAVHITSPGDGLKNASI